MRHTEPAPGALEPWRVNHGASHGRDTEMAQTWVELAAAATGQCRVLLIAGDAGLGKTHLLSQIGMMATDSGALVLSGGATEIEGMPPYFPLLDMLRGLLLDRPARILRRFLGHNAAVLAEILPELRDRLHRLAEAYRLPDDQARLRLFDAIGACLATASGTRTLVLLVDDLQWIDAASLAVLRHLIEARAIPRLLIAGCFRPGEAADNAALVAAIDRFNGLGALITLRLPPLGSEPLAAILMEYANGTIAPPVLDALFRQSEGNPFFARQLIEAWIEDGQVVRTASGWTAVSSFAPDGMPDGMTVAIGRRLSRLPAKVRETLSVASAIGRSFRSDMLAAVAAQDIDELESQLDEARRFAFIALAQDGAYRFIHDKIREYLYRKLLPARRRRLHAAVGAHLEARAASSGRPDAASLAFQFAQAGDLTRGRRYCREAGHLALAAHAPADAAGFFETAIELTPAGTLERSDLLLDLANAASRSGHLTRVVEAARESRDIGLVTGDRPTVVRASLWLARMWRVGDGDLTESRDLLATLAASLSDAERDDKIEVLALLADMEAMLGSHEAGVAHCREALALCEMSRDRRLEAATRHSYAKLLARMVGRQPDGAREAEHALRLAVETDDPWLAAQCCFRVAYSAMQLGAFRHCRSISEQRIRFARKCAGRGQLVDAWAWLAWLAAHRGDWETTARLVKETDAAMTGSADTQPLSFIARAQGYAALMRGEHESAISAFGAVSDILRKSPAAIGYQQGLLGLALARAGDREGALAYVAEQEALLAILPAGSVQAAAILTCLAEIALNLGIGQRLNDYGEALRPFAGQFHWFQVDRIQARIAMARKDWGSAENLLIGAEAAARREGLRPELAMTLMARGQLETARGAHGEDLVHDARRMFASLGMDAYIGDTGDITAGHERPEGGKHISRAGLSKREHQTLRLVADGLANREIARVLAISEHTVARHMTHIFNKLGVGNRVTAAALALRQGIV